MHIQRSLPGPAVRSVLRACEERRADLGGDVLSWPVPARPHQMMIIHLGEPYRVAIDGGRASTMSDSGLVGPQTYPRARVSLGGRVHVFSILFQPTGLNRLAGIDMTALLNQDPVAADVLGSSAGALRDAVLRASCFSERVAAVERWVESRLETRRPDGPIGRAARRMLADRGLARVDALAALSGLSARQFQRRFAEEVGMTPKLYARTIRFDRALLARRTGERRTWTEIAHDLGYFDQAHFIRECHTFAGLPPSALVGDWENVFFPGG